MWPSVFVPFRKPILLIILYHTKNWLWNKLACKVALSANETQLVNSNSTDCDTILIPTQKLFLDSNSTENQLIPIPMLIPIENLELSSQWIWFSSFSIYHDSRSMTIMMVHFPLSRFVAGFGRNIWTQHGKQMEIDLRYIPSRFWGKEQPDISG